MAVKNSSARAPLSTPSVIKATIVAVFFGVAELLILRAVRHVPEQRLILTQTMVLQALLVLPAAFVLRAVYRFRAVKRWSTARNPSLDAVALLLSFQLSHHLTAGLLAPHIELPLPASAVTTALTLLGWLLVARLLSSTARSFAALPALWVSRLVAIAGVALLVILSWSALGLLSRSKGDPGALNVLLIVMDTTRADYLSAYGYGRPTTPYLDELAENAIVFEQAYAAAPWTLPSHASMFTGVHPSVHGAHFERGYLDRSLQTLAESLRQGGYRTVAAHKKVWLHDETGVLRGFDDRYDVHYRTLTTAVVAAFRRLTEPIPPIDEAPVNYVDRGAIAINHAYLGWLRRHGEDPFFAFLNYNEAHSPYRPPPAFRRQFLKNQETEWGRTDLIDVDSFLDGKLDFSEEDFSVFRDLYAAAVAYQDWRIGQVLAALERENLLDRTVIIVTSDHGENIGDHDLLDHQYCIYDTLLHVPLIVHHPRLKQRLTIDTPVETRLLGDLVRALLDSSDPDGADAIVASVTSQGALVSELFEKSALSPSPAAHERRLRRTVSALLDRIGRLLPASGRQTVSAPVGAVQTAVHPSRRTPGRFRALRSDQLKYIWRSTGEEELYDLVNDPAELDNLALRQAGTVESLRALLDQWSNALPAAEHTPASELSDELKSRLRAIGYLD